MLKPIWSGLPTARSLAKEIVRVLGRPGVWRCSCPDGEINEHIIARHVLDLLQPRLQCDCGRVKLRLDWTNNTWFVDGPYYAPYGWVYCAKCDWRTRILPDLKAERNKGGKGRWAGNRPRDVVWHYASGAEAPVGEVRGVPSERDKGVRHNRRPTGSNRRYRGRGTGTY